MIIQRFNLNLIPNQSPVIVHVNQYDTGTGRLVATLYEGNEPYSPNGTAVIQGTKPDGHGFQYTATLDGNVVTADITDQMAPVAGDVRTQIVVTESSGVTGTFVFIMRVQPSALPSDTDMSESDYQYIEEAIREAQEAVETAQEATETAQEAVERAEAAISETQENAEDSEAWAQGTRGGIPVESTDPTYEHNAEYWAQYAERYAQGGLHYKSSIPFADIPTTGMREGDMYNITDDFTTDSRFEEGAGIEVKGGTNIAWNSDNKWDVLALPPKTTFNGRSGSILPMAGDYDSRKILLSSTLHIGGETQSDVQEALEALSNDGVKSFNGRSGSILPMAGDYDSEKILLSSILHIGGETQNNVQEALEALSEDGVQSFNGRSGSVLPIAGDYDSEKILLTSVLHIGGETQDNVQEALEALEKNKADKVNGAVEDNFAGLDADGNLKDSGKKASDFATPSDIAGQQSLLKDTVGWTGKNFNKGDANHLFIKSTARTFNFSFGRDVEQGNQYTVSFDVSAISGYTGNTAIGVRFIGGSDSSDDWYVPTNASGRVSHTFTARTDSVVGGTDSYVYIYIPSSEANDATITLSNIMFVDARIVDPTYEPFHESVEVMYEEEIHGINLLTLKSFANAVVGLTATLNSDKSITINGTSTATDNIYFSRRGASDATILDEGNYILSVGTIPSTCRLHLSYTATNGTNVVVAYGEYGNGNLSFTVSVGGRPWNVILQVNNGATFNNLKIYPMLRKAEIEDSTYRPYNYQAIQNQLNAQGVLGAKNLLPNAWSSATKNGITFTANSDGSVTANGTATADTEVSVDFPVSNLIKGESYILNGCPSGGSVSKYTVDIFGIPWNAADFPLYRDTGYGVAFTVPRNMQATTFRAHVFIANGQTVNNLVFYPMLRLASDPDDTYAPYAMTNRELTVNMLTALFSHPIRLTSSDDLDNVKTAGIYEIVNSVPTNAPSGLSSTTYSTVFVLSTGGSAAITQIYIQGGWRPTDKHIAIRGYGSSPLAWSAWRYITDSAS